MLAYDFKTGKRIWETTIADASKGEFVAGRSDRLERTGLHRQRGRRRQGRQGAHVCARRQDRQDRLGILPRAEDRGRSRPAVRKAPRRSIRRPGATRPDSRSAAARPGRRTRSTRTPENCTCRSAIPRPLTRSACARARISITDSVVVLDAMTGAYKRHFKLVPQGLARLGRRQRARSDSHGGRQEAAFGRAQGRTSLRRSTSPTTPSSIARR